MEPEEIGALLDAAGIGWIRFESDAPVIANAVATALGLADAPLLAWVPRLEVADREALAAVIGGLMIDAPPTTLHVRADEGAREGAVEGSWTALRVTLRRSAAVIDALVVDESAAATVERDLAEAEELIALLPPHVFWEAADISKQRTIQARLEAMVAERTGELERQIVERERAEREAVAASRAKSEFLTNVSHELRTPLNAVLGYAELVLEELGDPAVDRAVIRGDVERIVGAGGLLLQLVSELLDLSRIEAGTMALREAALELGPWLAAELAAFEGRARANHSRCEAEIDPALGEIVVDSFKLRRIIQSLLGNACKYTAGGVITARARALDERSVEVAIADTGSGIPEARLATLFAPFVRASLVCEGEGGVGLTLAIVHGYAELMGGSLTVESAVGVGTTFRLILPRRRLSGR